MDAVPVARSIYGQVACGTCKCGPPKDARGLCALCLAGVVPGKRRARTDSAVVVDAVPALDAVTIPERHHFPTANDPQKRFSSLTGPTPEKDADARAKRLARSKAWHEKQRQLKKGRTV